jgi:hypothetical protein
MQIGAKERKKSQKRTVFGTWSKSYEAWAQSYDFDLQRQRCKFLQRHGYSLAQFENRFLNSTLKNALAH